MSAQDVIQNPDVIRQPIGWRRIQIGRTEVRRCPAGLSAVGDGRIVLKDHISQLADVVIDVVIPGQARGFQISNFASESPFALGGDLAFIFQQPRYPSSTEVGESNEIG